MALLPGSRTAGFIASPPAVPKPCGLPFASVVSTFPVPSGKPKLHETSALMSIPGEELHNMDRCGQLEKSIFLHAGKLKTLYGGAESCRVVVIASKHRERRLKVLDVVVDLS